MCAETPIRLDDLSQTLVSRLRTAGNDVSEELACFCYQGVRGGSEA